MEGARPRDEILQPIRLGCVEGLRERARAVFRTGETPMKRKLVQFLVIAAMLAQTAAFAGWGASRRKAPNRNSRLPLSQPFHAALL
jgi:hypothetical protein